MVDTIIVAAEPPGSGPQLLGDKLGVVSCAVKWYTNNVPHCHFGLILIIKS